MALQTIKSGLFLPSDKHLPSTGSSLLIDATGEKVGFIFRVPKTGSITKVGFRTGTVTTSQSLSISMQTLDASGDPSGTAYGGSAAGTQASVVTDTFYEVTLATAASATAGDYVAAVIEYSSTVGSLNIKYNAVIAQRLPYCDLYTTLWTKSIGAPILTIGYSDGTYEPTGTWPNITTALTFNSASATDEIALRFSLPFPCRVSGYWVIVDLDGDGDIVLYEGTTALITSSLTSVNRSNTNNNVFFGLFSTPQLITKNTVYYLSLKPTTTTSLTGYYFNNLSSAAMMDMLEGGQNLYYASRVDAGAWTDNTLSRPLMGLIIDQMDDGVGSGGGGLLVGQMGGLNG